jgi:hypothetical protein
MAEDLFIGQHLRQTLESEHQMKFPTREVADMFSHEHGSPKHITFGFHAIYNLWRHVSYIQLVEIIKEISVLSINNPSTALLLIKLLRVGQVTAFKEIFGILVDRIGPQALLSNYIIVTRDVERATKEFRMGMALNKINNVDIKQ